MTFFSFFFLTDYIDFVDFTDSTDSRNVLDYSDSIEVTDSMDIIDSIDSILVPHKETATHKGKTKVPMGGGEAAAIDTFVRARSAHPFVCGGLSVWCKHRNL